MEYFFKTPGIGGFSIIFICIVFCVGFYLTVKWISQGRVNKLEKERAKGDENG